MGLTFTPKAPHAAAPSPAATLTTLTTGSEVRPVILGLDISTKCGVALLDHRWGPLPTLHMETLHYETEEALEKKAAKKEKRAPNPTPIHQFARWKQYEDTFGHLLDLWKPMLAVVESYGFASQSLGTTVEIGTHFKRVLFQRGIPWVELSPNGLKKFCTGKGSGDKNVIMVEAYKRFGIDTKDDNQCDAALLAYAGAALVGLPVPALPAPHLAALAGIALPPGVQSIAKTA